jgi:drug/metabolite transporter (DMT)-like permease
VARGPAVLGIVAISFSAVYVVLAGVSPGTSAFFRGFYALPVLAVLYLFLRGRDNRPARDRWIAVLAGVLLGIDLNLWHRSIDYVGAGLATVLGNTQVLFVAGLAWVFHREPPSRIALVAVPVALVGVLLTAGVGQSVAFGSNPRLGAFLGVLTALAYAGFILLFRAGNRGRGHPAGPLFDATIGVTASCFIMGIAFDPAFSLRPVWPAHAWLLALALGAHTIGWLLIATTLPRLPALDTSILLLLQPTLTMIWGVLLFAEAPSPGQLVGVALVLAAVALATAVGAARRRPVGATPGSPPGVGEEPAGETCGEAPDSLGTPETIHLNP